MKKMIFSILLILTGLSFIPTSAEGEIRHEPQDTRSMSVVKPDLNWGEFPLYFIFNKGQVNQRVTYYAKTSGYTLWLTKQGLVFDSMKREKVKENSGKIHSKFKIKNSKLTKRDVSRLVFVKANKNPEMMPVQETKLRVNYFLGNDRSKWQCNIPTSQAVLYKNLYKHIDLKVYGIEREIEYDWIVKPGGDPGTIRFAYKNVKAARIDDQGNLLIETNFGKLIHKKPVGYQRRAQRTALRAGRKAQRIASRAAHVEVGFKKIAENIFGFEVGQYDKRFELIIDPVVLAYSTYCGGGNYDQGYGIAVDNSGFAYVTGYTSSVDFPILEQYQTNQSSTDAFIIKIDTTQSGASSLIYATYLGGDDEDNGGGIAVDNSGNAYVTGYTKSSDFPNRDQYQTDQSGADAFVTKIDTTQSGASGLIYSTYLGGSGDEYGYGIAVDNNGYAYVTGYTKSSDFPNRDQYQTDQPGTDAFVTKIDTTQSGTSSLIYSTYLGGDGDDYGWGIAVDNSGKTYVTGYTYSSDFPTLNEYQAKQSSIDAFVTKIDTTQSGASGLIYSTCLGGDNLDFGYGIAVDNSGFAYVTGCTWSSDFPTLHQYQTNQPYSDVFVTKIDMTQSGTSSLIYSTYLGGEEGDYGRGIAADNSGNAYVTGYTVSTNFPSHGQYQTLQQGTDTFVAKLDTTLSGISSLIFSTYLGGDDDDYGWGIAVDGSGYVYVTGSTYSSDFPTLGQYQANPGGSDADTFVTKLNYTLPYPPTVITTPVSSITASSAVSGGNVTSDGGAVVTARGMCWSSSPHPTLSDNVTTDGTGTGVFTSSMTGLTPFTDYYVRAYATNTAGTVYGNEERFTTSVPSITITSPNGGENWLVGSQHNITWTNDGFQGYVRIEYSIDNGSNWTEITPYTPGDGSHPWTVPDTASNQCLISISDTNGRLRDISDSVFSIITPPPLTPLTVTSPNGGENWQFGSNQNITWTAHGVDGSLEITLWKKGILVGTIARNINPASGSYPWTVGNLWWSAIPPGTDYKIKIKETGTTVSDMSDNFFAITLRR